MRYNCLPHPLFVNTLITESLLLGGNKCPGVYAISFGWACTYLTKTKGEAHETLSTLFQRDGVLPALIIDNSKEQVLGGFHQKLKEADYHLKQTQP